MTACFSLILVLVILLVGASVGIAVAIAWGLQHRDRVTRKEGR